MTNEECYKSLGAAIVLQAFKDYRRCAKILHSKASPAVKAKAEKEMDEIEKFVKSDWYAILTDIPSHKMLKRLKEVRNG